MYSASPSSSTEPPVSWFARCKASITFACGMLNARSRTGSDRGLRLVGEPRLHLVQVFEHPRARPVGVGAVLEEDVHEVIAEERIAAHGLRSRHREHRR